MISKSFKRNQKVRCFNCGKSDHLKKDYRQWVPGKNGFFKDNPNTRPSPLEYAEGMTKGSIALMNADQQGTDKATLCHCEIP